MNLQSAFIGTCLPLLASLYFLLAIALIRFPLIGFYEYGSGVLFIILAVWYSHLGERMARAKSNYVIWARGKRSKGRNTDPIFQVQYRDLTSGVLGNPISTGQTTKAAAKEWAIRHQGLISQKKNSEIISFLHDFYEADSEFLKYTQVRKPISKSQISHKRSRLENYIIPTLEALRIQYFQKLSIDVIEKMQLAISKQIGPKTMNETFRAFREACTWAIKKGYLDHDPFIGYQPYSAKRRQRGSLTKDEVYSLWSLGMDDKTRLLLFIPLFGGLRIGELQALRVSSMQEGRIYVDRSYESREGFKGPKGSTNEDCKWRYTSLPKALKSISDRFIDGKDKTALLFSPVGSSKVFRNDNIYDIFHEQLARIGIGAEARKLRNIQIHSSRRFFNSFLLDCNFNQYNIQHLMGHTGSKIDSNEMTARYFSALYDIEKVNAYFDDWLSSYKSARELEAAVV